MANKKTSKKHKKLRKTGTNKDAAAKKPMTKRLARKTPASKKKLARKNRASKKAEARTKSVGKKSIGEKTVVAKTEAALKRQVLARSRGFDREPSDRQGPTSESAGQSGDLQGLSNIESADSESVDELLEEGNAFEADAVAGVESAGDADEKEVRTHEVLEDDVPGEYLDEE